MDPITRPTRIYKHSSAGTDWAAAVTVGGTDSAKWLTQEQLQRFQVFAVDRYEQSAWEI